MNYFILYLVIGLVTFIFLALPILVVVFLFKTLKKEKNLSNVIDKYQQESKSLPYHLNQGLFNASELVFFNILNASVDAQRYTVFPKVRLGDYIQPTNHGAERWGSWNRIKSRHVDFIIWDLTQQKIVLAIELDGSSHNSKLAYEADAFKDEVFKSISLPLKRIRVGSNFEQEINKIINYL